MVCWSCCRKFTLASCSFILCTFQIALRSFLAASSDRRLYCAIRSMLNTHTNRRITLAFKHKFTVYSGNGIQVHLQWEWKQRTLLVLPCPVLQLLLKGLQPLFSVSKFSGKTVVILLRLPFNSTAPLQTHSFYLSFLQLLIYKSYGTW